MGASGSYLLGGIACILLGIYVPGCGPAWFMIALGALSLVFWYAEVHWLIVLQRRASKASRSNGPPPTAKQSDANLKPSLEITDTLLGRLVFDEDERGWFSRALREHGFGRILISGDRNGPTSADLEAGRFYWSKAAEVSESVMSLLRLSVNAPEWRPFADEIEELQLGDLHVYPARRGRYAGRMCLQKALLNELDDGRCWACELDRDNATALVFDS